MFNCRGKVLVVGAAGLLGQAICCDLLEKGYEVVALIRPWGSKIEISPSQKLEIVEVDLESNFDIRKLLSSSVSCVMYCAQSIGHNQFPKMSGAISSLNFSVPIKIIEQSIEAGVGMFVYSSSGGVYESRGCPLSEDLEMRSDDDLNLYLSTKVFAEKALLKFSRLINLTICRYFFIYGPNQRQEMLIPRMITRVMEQEEIDIAQNRGPMLNPVYSSDAARATIHLFEKGISGLFNIAGNQVLSLKEICNIIGARLGMVPVYRDTPDVPIDFVADLSRLFEAGFRHEYDFETGVENLLPNKFRSLCVG